MSANSKSKWNGRMIQNMEKEDSCRKTANTEYVPTKCRVTKPPPPKPATNPLQFVMVGPCPLYKKAQEQIKKASDVKVIRKEVREEAEDWQHNLDSWKTNRRKMQEHIIERVEEVKKLEQEGQERTRKKSAFSEKRGRRFNIPVYDDDSNDLSDYGIGLSSSKSDKSSDNASQSSKDDINECQMYGSNDMNVETKPNDNDIKTDQLNNHINNLKAENVNEFNGGESNIGQYTYEGAIQNYRMRIKTKINVNEVMFNNRQPDPPKNKEYNEAQSLLRKGNICRRKELFEAERNSADNPESSAQRKFSEDFANSQSIKERLQSLEKCTEASLKNDNRNSLPVGTVTSKLQKFNSVTESYSTKHHFAESPVKSASSYSLDGMSSGGEETKPKWGEKYEYNQYFSPGDRIFMDKINMFNRDLDTLYPKASSDNSNDEMLNSYPPSTSSTELMLLSSDKEDSGIHTADVSCSVSQSDEVLEDPDIPSNTIPKCIEKLNIEKITKENQLIDLEDNAQTVEDNIHQERNVLLLGNGHENRSEDIYQNRNVLLEENVPNTRHVILEKYVVPKKNVVLEENIHENGISEQNALLEESPQQNSNVILEANVNQYLPQETILEDTFHEDKPITAELFQPITKTEEIFNNTPVAETVVEAPVPNFEQDLLSETQAIPLVETLSAHFDDLTLQNPPMDLPPFEIDCLEEDNVLLSPVLPKMQPPAVKPPPPPVSDPEPVPNSVDNDKKFNTTKRLKKEILIKRSTFLGLNEPTDEQIFPSVPIERPPDVNNFLQKLNGSREAASKEVVNEPLVVVENSAEIAPKITKTQQSAEEDEITKKEREIIEMVEKEEKCKDHEPIPSKEDIPNKLTNYSEQYPYNYNNPYYLDSHYDNLDDRDSEVLKVEHELLQLEREERERQRENMLFREKSMKMKQNYHSYENLCDVDVFPENADYYKSMPELQHVPKEQPVRPSVLNYKPMYENTSFYRKSMPDIEHIYNNVLEQDKQVNYANVQQPVMTASHRKASMPELQKVPQVVSNLPIIPAKPLKRPTKEEKEMFKCSHYEKQMKPIARHSLQPSSASRPRHHDNWRQPKINAEPKNYNQHWLIQEAEFRRISEMQKSMPNRLHSNAHLSGFANTNMPIKPARPEQPAIPKDGGQLPPPLSHPQQSGYSLMPYSSSTGIDESQNVILSVSGKKKCSYCGNELGRGAAMIIETLNLFYHMECFKCCVCHVELGDGLMGTDVRVRNQKLHCHNCYSSDDGVKFSCV